MLIVAVLYYANRRLHAPQPVRQATAGLVLAVTLVAVAVIVCSFSLMFVGGYRHLTSVQTSLHRYYLGYDAGDMAGDYVICSCNRLGWACRCHYVRNPDYDPLYQDLRLIPIPNGGVQFYRGDDLLYTWPGDEP